MADDQVRNIENFIEYKRLFVGGLYEGVSEQDLRLKFKLFGDVKDLEIISRHEASSGDHIKTFAYLNIGMCEKNFRKCLATYNKCNWKGHVLKVEVAREDYLTRLQKENEINVTVDETKDAADIHAVKDIKSAVPGTPVPNIQNWVIGKFGRALPIVFLRRKDGKKIAKFDPSKTVHCLKKLSENTQDHCVDKLTWSLDDPNTILNGVHKMSSSNTLSIKRTYQEIEGNNSYETKAKIRTKKSDCSLRNIQPQYNKDTFNGFSSNDCSGKINGESTSFSSINRSFENDPASSGSSSDESDSKDLQVVSCEGDSDFNKSTTLSTFVSAIINRQDQQDKPTPKPCHDALSSKENSEKKECKNKNDHNQANFSSNGESTSSESDQVSETKNYSNSVERSSVDELRSDETDVNDEQSSCCTSKLFKPKNEQLRSKKELSNKLRLETLEERKEVLRTQKEIVKNALQTVDTGPVNGGNHLVFDSCTHEKHASLLTDTKKISGSKAHAWLGMDSSSDENDDSNQSVDEFFGKEHFDGKSGEKLMKLQQKFGHDQRFKMDERFLESDDEMESTSNAPDFQGDDLSIQLKEEKLLSFKVLNDVLGSNSVFFKEDEDARNVYRDSIDTHYDPSREDHAKFEQEIKSCGGSKESKEHNITDDTLSTEKHEHATQEKFYSVSDSLKGFFTNKNQKNSTFSFSLELDEKKDHCQSAAESITDWKAPVKLSRALPYDSSASESEDDVEESKNGLVSSSVKTKTCLFYHPDDQGMSDARQAESSSFMRKESVENLTRYWEEVRQKITQDYKKKRKDALRRQKKTSYRKMEY